MRMLCQEISSYAKRKLSADTVYIGGGTPTVLDKAQLLSVISAVRDAFALLPETEFTVEMNPATASYDTLLALRRAGVNRLSIGVQSLKDSELRHLGRVHSADDAKASVLLAREAGFENISVDVMYAIPGQTKESLEDTIDGILALSPAHISAYSLILEEGTPLYEKRATLNLPDQDSEYELYELLTAKLAQAGYDHYEISNYAKNGKTSKHNLKYWHMAPYIGCGTSAHSYLDGVRYENTADLAAYLKKYGKCRKIEEVPTNADKAYEYAILGLRTKEGISIKAYEALATATLSEERHALIAKLVQCGYVNRNGDRLALTEKGFYVSSQILTELF